MSDAADFAGEAQAIHDDRLAARLGAERRMRERQIGTAECVDCEEEIAPRRREAMPWVTRCADCQSLAELRSRRR